MVRKSINLSNPRDSGELNAIECTSWEFLPLKMVGGTGIETSCDGIESITAYWLTLNLPDGTVNSGLRSNDRWI
jgi:hypothetical protein